MTIYARQDADYRNFVDNGDGTTSRYVRVTGPGSGGSGGLLQGLVFDSYYTTYPDTVTEVTVYQNLGSTVATVTTVWTDSTKEFHVSTVRT
jgi:translation elongation factor EF-4